MAGTSQVACDWQLHSGIFSSNVYVEDWRQQVQHGLFLGLRLQSALDVQSGQTLEMDGG